MNKTTLLCPEGHIYYEKHPVGRYALGCPICRIEKIEKELKILKKYIKRIGPVKRRKGSFLW